MIRLTRRYRFSASHRLHCRELSDQRNRELFGACNNPFGHGHDYVLELSVRGPVDESSGRVVHLGELDKLIRGEILETFQHKNINEQVPEFADTIPSTENLLADIERRLARRWSSVFPGPWPALDRIRIRETRHNIFETSTETSTEPSPRAI